MSRRIRLWRQWVMCFPCLAALALAITGPAAAQRVPLGTAFTYQGRLIESSDPATGAYDFEFRLFDAATGGSQIGATITRDDVAVENGLFTTRVDFGPGAFTGSASWIEASVRPGSSSGAYVTLAAREELTPTPNAINASGLSGHGSAYHLSRSNHSGTQPPATISPQGLGSGLDADTVDGQYAASLLDRSNHTGSQPPSSITPQGPGSNLDADTVDGMHASDLGAGSVNKVIRGVISFGGSNFQVSDNFGPPAVDPARCLVTLSPTVIGSGTGSFFNSRNGAMLVELTSTRITVAIDYNGSSLVPHRVSYQIVEYR